MSDPVAVDAGLMARLRDFVDNTEPDGSAFFLNYREASGLIAALKAERERGDWQPIETVPKYGRRVRLWLGSPYNREELARWYEPWERWVTGNYPTHPDDEIYGIGALIPTHWQPEAAPPPPALPTDTEH